MKCPKCQTESLTWMPALPNVGSPRVCSRRRAGPRGPGCRGLWVQRSFYQSPEARVFSEERASAGMTTAVDRDLKAGLCPHGHGLLGRTRVSLEPSFYLDRCSRCSGIWFDCGEWDRIAGTRLLDNLPQLWTRDWRRRQRVAEEHADHLAWARRRFGPELMAELQSLACRLESSAVRSEALAFLRETSRRGLRGQQQAPQ